jgi:hypothetical protein
VNTVMDPSGSKKMLGNYCVVEQLVASQEGVFSMELGA